MGLFPILLILLCSFRSQTMDQGSFIPVCEIVRISDREGELFLECFVFMCI